MSKLNITAMTSEAMLKEITIDSKGRGKITIRGAARLAGVQHSSLLRSFNTAKENPSKLVKRLFDRGYTAYNIESWAVNGIPDIALSFILTYYGYEADRYRTDDAIFSHDFFAGVGARVKMQEMKGWKAPEIVYQQPQLPYEFDKASAAYKAMYSLADVDKKLVAGAFANSVIRQHPEIAGYMEDAKKDMTIPIESQLVTATTIGEMCQEALLQAGHPAGNKEISPQKINKLLIRAGYQVKNPLYNKSSSGLAPYEATELGKPFSKLEMVPGKGQSRTVLQLRWHVTIVEKLLPLF